MAGGERTGGFDTPGTDASDFDPGAAERGQRPSGGSGEVHGSGAGTGGGGTPEDYDHNLDSAQAQEGGRP